MNPTKIVFLASDCESSRWVYHALKEEFLFAAVIIEKPVSKKTVFKNRMKKIGFARVMGQAMFSLMIAPILKWKASKRKAELINQYHLINNDFDENVKHVSTVNDEACKEILQQLNPDIVLVNGTRIISKKTLESTSAIFINMHVGVTPMYRGSHGGYWAIHNNDVENFGTTIHLIDAGIDTGAVLKQVFIKPDKADNFTTYPLLQTAIGITALKTVLPQVMKGDFNVKQHSEKGKIYYQPTVWEYFFKS